MTPAPNSPASTSIAASTHTSTPPHSATAGSPSNSGILLAQSAQSIQPGRRSQACRRCRRLRVKCVRPESTSPCEACHKAKDECVVFHGPSSHDRAYRNPKRAHVDPAHNYGDLAVVAGSSSGISDGGETRSQSQRRSPEGMILPSPGPTMISSVAMFWPRTNLGLGGPSSTHISWDDLPPFEEVVEGVTAFTTSFFQLGFIPRSLFFEVMRREPESISLFLILTILSVSARFTPSLVRRFQSGVAATQAFLSQAGAFVPDQMFNPTLDSIQGFFLMSIAEWGNGDKNRSSVYMGIAIRLAGMLRLHREETYQLPQNASREAIVLSEVARRTFWMIETFENLHSGSNLPVAFSYKDVTVLLPCDEREFTFGIRPRERAAMPGTPPALRNPALSDSVSRSLFATLLQTHCLWGQVARLVSSEDLEPPSSLRSETNINKRKFEFLSQTLASFEAGLSPQHSWSVWNLRAHKVEGLDLAYLSVAMVLRLSNVILRRSYLHDVLSARHSPDGVALSARADPSSPVLDELFDNMLTMDEQIVAFFEHKSPDQGYPALIVFCVYVCGSLANNLCQQPHICPRIAPQAVRILKNSIQGLETLQDAWPLARRWYQALYQASEPVLRAPSTPLPNPHRNHPPANGERPNQFYHQPQVDVQFNDPVIFESMFAAFDPSSWNNLLSGEGIETFAAGHGFGQ
ncbi:hypothetical protein GGR57DRAFT_262298 [Xylariaceae sp. FL1272]|nr:hypothetical protein GGR57DRAFT_262298 [Xylariaceae sp. FL1272]